MQELGRGRDYRQNAAQMALLERIALGIEKLAEDPIVEMEVAPPVCPHCGVFNPNVTTSDIGGTGRLAEFHVALTCEECGKPFWGTPVQWSMHLEMSTLRREILERAEYVGHGASGNRT